MTALSRRIYPTLAVLQQNKIVCSNIQLLQGRMGTYNNSRMYVLWCNARGWLCLVILEGCSKYGGKGMALRHVAF